MRRCYQRCFRGRPQAIAVTLEAVSTSADQGIIDTLATATHKSNLPGWITHHEGVRGNVVNHDRPSSDEGVHPESNATNDRGVGSDGGALMNLRVDKLLVGLLDLRPGVQVVREDRIRTNEDMITQRHAVPEGHAILNSDAISNRDVRFYETVIADIAVTADHRALHHMSKSPYASPFANGVGFDQSLRMHKVRS